MLDGSPVPPQAGAYLWNWFTEIMAGLGVSGFGCPTITWSDLRAWSEFMHVRLDYWEARALIRMSLARAEIISKKK